ncbi:uncharacterized protein [Ptychodera flava]|uniref:uncharacterized protein n=1 Tax=Ptychodera flava TaxID=63121 RepID=UPI00396A6D85
MANAWSGRACWLASLQLVMILACGLCLDTFQGLVAEGDGPKYTFPSHHEWRKEFYPNPRNVSRGSIDCGRDGNASWICDPNNVLNEDEADVLDAFSEEIALGTECVCPQCKVDFNGTQSPYGYVIGIAIVNKMDASYENINCPTKKELAEEAEQWSNYLLDKSWKIGDCGNSIIVFFSREDNTVDIATAEIAGEALPPDHIQHITGRTLKYFESHDYFNGLYYILDQVNRTLVTGLGLHEPQFTDLQMYGIVFAAVVLPFLLFVVVFIWCINPKELGKKSTTSSESSLSFRSFSEPT